MFRTQFILGARLSLISVARSANVDDRHCNDITLAVHSKMHMAVHEIHAT
jgi:hypothetical protein